MKFIIKGVDKMSKIDKDLYDFLSIHANSLKPELLKLAQGETVTKKVKLVKVIDVNSKNYDAANEIKECSTHNWNVESQAGQLITYVKYVDEPKTLADFDNDEILTFIKEMEENNVSLRDDKKKLNKHIDQLDDKFKELTQQILGKDIQHSKELTVERSQKNWFEDLSKSFRKASYKNTIQSREIKDLYYRLRSINAGYDNLEMTKNRYAKKYIKYLSLTWFFGALFFISLLERVLS